MNAEERKQKWKSKKYLILFYLLEYHMKKDILT